MTREYELEDQTQHAENSRVETWESGHFLEIIEPLAVTLLPLDLMLCEITTTTTKSLISFRTFQWRFHISILESHTPVLEQNDVMPSVPLSPMQPP